MNHPHDGDAPRSLNWLATGAMSPSDLLTMFDSALDAIVLIDPVSRIISWNRSAERTFGWSRDEAIGRQLDRLIIPETLRAAHRAGMAHYLETGDGPVLNQRIEVPALHRSGHEIPVELTIIPLGVKDGLRFCAFMRDISLRKKNAQRLERRHLEAEVLYEVVALLSQGGSLEESFRLCQQKICEITGWSAGHSYQPDDADNPHALLPSGVWHFADKALTPLEQASEGVTFRPGEGLPGQVWVTGQPVWSTDIANDPNFLRRELFSAMGVCGAFAFPVRADNRLAVVLEFFSTELGDPEPELIFTVRSLAEQLGRVLERHLATAQQQVLVRELTHRIGNTLAITGAILRRLAATSSSKEELYQRFETRLMALAAGHKMLSESDWRSTQLATLVRETLAPYCEGDADACVIDGCEVELSPRLTMVMNMVLHELATNAAKYGALSVPEGRLSIRWTVEPSETPVLKFLWLERDGPAVTQDDEGLKSGFGSELIRLMMGQSRGSESKVDLAPEGLRAELTLPLRDLPAPPRGPVVVTGPAAT